MTYIIYNKADPNMPDVDYTPYVVFKNTLQEAQDNFSWVSENLQPGEALMLVSVDLERGKLVEDIVKQGINNDWDGYNAVIHDSISHFFSDEEWEEDD